MSTQGNEQMRPQPSILCVLMCVGVGWGGETSEESQEGLELSWIDQH